MSKRKNYRADHDGQTDPRREFMGVLPRRSHHVHQPTMLRGKSFAVPELLAHLACESYPKLEGDL
jgi:hypothetical protein